MSDLTITNGGVSVSTDELQRLAEQSRGVSAQLRDLLTELPAARPGLDWSVSLRLAAARARLDEVADDATRLAAAVAEAAEGYARADVLAADSLRTAASSGGWMAGAALQLAGPVVVLAGLHLLLPALAAGALQGLSPARSLGVLADGVARSDLFADPRAVRALRAALSALDDAHSALRGAPMAESLARGDTGTGETTHAAAVLGLVGVLRGITGEDRLGTETGVEVQRVATSSAAPPQNLADLVARIPDGGEAGQIRVEAYTPASGERTFIVYAGGTREMALIPGEEAFDGTSNVSAFTGVAPAASAAAIGRALDRAGARPGDRVLTVGYSQGGLAAARFAQSSPYSVGTVVAVGSPLGHVPRAEGTRFVELVHRDDPVPALEGLRRPRPTEQRDVVIEATSAGAGSQLDGSIGSRDDGTAGSQHAGTAGQRSGGHPAGLLAGHELARYRQTAAEAALRDDPRMRALAAELRTLTGGSTGMSTSYRATRSGAVSADGSGGG